MLSSPGLGVLHGKLKKNRSEDGTHSAHRVLWHTVGTKSTLCLHLVPEGPGDGEKDGPLGGKQELELRLVPP